MPEHKPVVIIVGGGFGGLAAARALKKAPVKVVLIGVTTPNVKNCTLTVSRPFR
jgi:2-polyprenyl-6-methoxyphenol hydroxylase-like FAD-dependent oxidoreductase